MAAVNLHHTECSRLLLGRRRLRRPIEPLRIRTRSLELGWLAVGVLVFAAASFTVQFGYVHTWESWAGLVIAASLALVVLADRSLARRLRPVSLAAGATAVAGAALVTSLFLPWQKECFEKTGDLQGLGIAGRCLSADGFNELGSTAAVLTIVLVAVVATSVMRLRSTVGIAVAVGLFVATLGFGVETGNFGSEHLGFGYGAFVGFAAAGSLLAFVVLDVTWRLPVPTELVPNLVPIVLAAAFVLVVVVPWWGVLPNAIESVLIPDLSWLTLARAMVGLRIADLWIRQTQRVSDHAPELVALSIALVALAVVENAPTVQLTWRTGVLLGISVPLALLAIVEARGGLRNFHVPEILRVDRI